MIEVYEALISESYLDPDHDRTWNEAAAIAILNYQSDWQMEITMTVTPDLAKHIMRDHPETRSQWLKDAKGCEFWNHSPSAQETVEWSGGCTDGKGSGTGTQIFRSVRNGEPRTSSYFGSIDAGKANGTGTYLSWDGFFYKGDFKDDQAQGQGTMRHVNGTLIIGTFVNSLANGQAEVFWPWGEHYKGTMVDGLMNGQGTFTFADGKTYSGDVVNDYFTGQGKMTWPDGDVYDGAWLNDRPHGQGAAVINGNPYEGTWENGCFKGIADKPVWIFASNEECASSGD